MPILCNIWSGTIQHTVLQSNVGELAVVDLVLLKLLSFSALRGHFCVKMYKFGVISICRCYCLMLLLLHCSQYHYQFVFKVIIRG